MQRFPIGASVTLEQLEDDPHPVLARLRAGEPVSWIPVLGGWLVTRHELVLAVMRDSQSFTVDDPRFSTARVVGPSMLSLDGAEHARHRAPFAGVFRPGPVRERFGGAVRTEAERLIERLAQDGRAELRRAFAGPLAASVVASALGLEARGPTQVLAWYDAIVGAVSAITAGQELPHSGAAAFGELSERLAVAVEGRGEDTPLAAVAVDSTLSTEQIVSNAAVLLFGGIETTEGMISNALLHLLERPERAAAAREDQAVLDAAIEESLRLEPAAAVIDRYAVGDAAIGGAEIRRGDLVRLSISGANRDPQVFPDPDRFDLSRANVRRHLAFAHGPHVCLGIHLARLEARTAISLLLRRLPDLRLDSEQGSRITGLVFRKPRTLEAVWG